MKFKYYILFLLALSIGGCNLIGEIDDITAENVITDKTQITNAKSVELAVNGVYASWRVQGVAWFPHYLRSLVGTAGVAPLIGATQFSENEVKFDNTGITDNYTGLYFVINTANTFIANLEKTKVSDLSEERRTQVIAEARFHRALAHFYLLRNFGEFYKKDSKFGVVTHNIPIRENISKARSSVADSYKFIIEDLVQAVKDAPKLVDKHYYIGTTAVKALLAKVYLYNADFVNAAKWAEQVIKEAEENGYLLEDSYLDIFKKQHDSKEIIFAPYIVQELNDPIIPQAYGTISIPSSSFIKRIANELVPGEGKDSRFLQAYPALDGDSFHGDFKYPALSGNKGEVGHTRFMLRLAELYFIAAEAEFRKDGGDKALAKEYLQIVATRAGYAEDYASKITEKDFLETLLKHKYIELCNETGEAWYDFVRYKMLDNLKIDEVYVKSDRNLLFPIPEKALAGNDLLEQNPGY